MKTRIQLLSFVAASLAAIFLSGCGGRLRPDPDTTAPIKAQYPSAEFRACGKLWNGLGICTLKQGESFDSVSLAIQGYFKGTVKVDGTACRVNQQMDFDQSALVPVSIPGTAVKDCVLTFVMATEFPNQKNNAVTVYPLRGHLLVKVLRPGDDWKGDVMKVTGNWQYQAHLWVGADSGSVRAVFNGCGHDVDQQVPLKAGYADFRIDKAFKYGVKTCVLDGALIHPEIQDPRVDYLIAQYDPSFHPLSIPVVKMNGNKLTVTADEVVSAIALDGQYIVDNKGTFEIDPSVTHVFRAVTVKGRTVIGILKKGKWTWLQ